MDRTNECGERLRYGIVASRCNSTASIDIVASDGNNCSSVFYPMKTQPPSRTLFLTTPFVVRTEMKTSSSEPLLILQAAATTHTLLNESRANYSNRASL